SKLPHLSPFIRHPSARKWLRHSNRPGVVRAQGCEHDYDLHARAQQARDWGEEPARLKGEKWAKASRPPANAFTAFCGRPLRRECERRVLSPYRICYLVLSRPGRSRFSC